MTQLSVDMYESDLESVYTNTIYVRKVKTMNTKELTTSMMIAKPDNAIIIVS
jgi:hypothetical protein